MDTGLFEAALRGAAEAQTTRAGGITARDLVLVLAAAARSGEPWRAVDLARELGLPAYEVVVGLERARRVGLLDAEKRRARVEPLLEFLAHGLRYVFPAEIGPERRGIATAELAGRFVWPREGGAASGLSLAPLDACAARASGSARELLSLVDVLRAGRAWERALALREIRRRSLDARGRGCYTQDVGR